MCWKARMLEDWNATVCLSLSATLGPLDPWPLEPFLTTNWEKNQKRDQSKLPFWTTFLIPGHQPGASYPDINFHLNWAVFISICTGLLRIKGSQKASTDPLVCLRFLQPSSIKISAHLFGKNRSVQVKLKWFITPEQYGMYATLVCSDQVIKMFQEKKNDVSIWTRDGYRCGRFYRI